VRNAGMNIRMIYGQANWRWLQF